MKSKQTIINTLSNCKRTENSYVSNTTGEKYSEGIKELIELCDCHWFVDDALSICRIYKDIVPFITIDFKKTDNKSTVIYSDGAERELFRQEYNLVNFPLDKQRLFYCKEKLILPSEW